MSNGELRTALEPVIRLLYDETFIQSGNSYLDPESSFIETLASVDATQASRPVSATCASIAGQVEHLRVGLDMLLNLLHGREVAPIDWPLTWNRTVVSEEEWQLLRSNLTDLSSEIRTALDDDAVWNRENMLLYVLDGLVHAAYHLGEIRQALCTVQRG